MTSLTTRILRASAFGALLFGYSMGAPALAQDDGAAPTGQTTSRTGLETIMVSGTKREEAVQTVPISVSAISENQIKNTFRTDILAITDLAPNVALGQLPGFRAIAGGIRGTGQNSILVTQDSSVVILVDEFGLSRVQSQFVPLFDIERVEVFRGPQGTLFGKSATGGAISIITKRPVMNEFTGQIEGQIGKFGSASKGMIGKANIAVNVPVVEDKLAFRITALYDYDDGAFRNDKVSNNFPNVVPIYDGFGLPVVNPPFPADVNTKNVGDGERTNGTDVFAGSFKALFQPTDNYEAYFIFRVLRDRSDTVPGVNESPALGEVDPGLFRLANGDFVRNNPTFMLLPLLGFDGIHTTGQTNVYSTGVTDTCWDKRAFCNASGHRVSVEEYHLHQKLTLDEATLQLLVGYRNHREILPDTYTGEAFKSLFDASRNSTEEQFQIEFRASTQFDGPFNFVFGATYQTHKVDMLAYTTVGLSDLLTFEASQDPMNANPLIAAGLLDLDGNLNLFTDTLNGDFSMTGAKQDRETYAIYLDGTWEITDKLSLTGGVRYTYDSKDFLRRANPGGPCTSATPAAAMVDVNGVCLDSGSNRISRAIALGLVDGDITFDVPLPISAFEIGDDFSDHWDRLTWRVVLDYQFSEDGLAYLSYSTGFIPGGFTETCSTVQTCVPFESETNWNLEGGIKAQWFDRTLQTNLSVFYTRYSNLIRSQVVPFTNIFGVTTQETINLNAGKSEVFGVELEMTWVPTDNLRFDLSVGYMDHSYVEFMLGGQDISDLKVPFSPKWSVNGGVTYDMLLGNAGTLTWNTTFAYQSEAENTVFNSLYSQMSERFLWDANVTYRDTQERYRLTLFVKNILNKHYRTGANPVAGLWNFTNYGRPLEYGVEFGFYF